MNKPEILNAQIRDMVFGQGVKIVEPVNLYGFTLGDQCFIGPFVEIQQKVAIGNRTRVQSHSFICEGVEVGEDCFIGHGVMFINDVFAEGRPAIRLNGKLPALATVCRSVQTLLCCWCRYVTR